MNSWLKYLKPSLPKFLAKISNEELKNYVSQNVLIVG